MDPAVSYSLPWYVRTPHCRFLGDFFWQLAPFQCHCLFVSLSLLWVLVQLHCFFVVVLPLLAVRHVFPLLLVFFLCKQLLSSCVSAVLSATLLARAAGNACNANTSSNLFCCNLDLPTAWCHRPPVLVRILCLSDHSVTTRATTQIILIATAMPAVCHAVNCEHQLTSHATGNVGHRNTQGRHWDCGVRTQTFTTTRCKDPTSQTKPSRRENTESTRVQARSGIRQRFLTPSFSP